MVQRRRIVILAVASAAAVALAAIYLTRTSDGLTDPRAAHVTRANFQRIQEGMSADEINEILGVPPGDYRRSRGFVLVGPGHVPRTNKAQGGRLEVWYVPRHHVEVLFDREGRVAAKYWHDSDEGPTPPSP
jgi:outer membrane protein assembly factor BamE (lipoprotein component of BamABCDE complex)